MRLLVILSFIGSLQALDFQKTDQSKNLTLHVNVLTDDYFQFELGKNLRQQIIASPMVAQNPKSAKGTLSVTTQGFKTSKLDVTISDDLCITVKELKQGKVVLRTCPSNFERDYKRLYTESYYAHNFYGLGHNFYDGNADGDLSGRHIFPGGDFGNALKGFSGGANGASIFPILYGLEKDGGGYFLFFDQAVKQEWKFGTHARPVPVPFYDIDFAADTAKGYFKFASDLKTLKRTYMDLTGRPLMAPKKAFGLWVSEFGFDSFFELFNLLDTIRKDNFPLDGFGMDIQWFGGRFIQDGVFGNSQFGNLLWDRVNFQNPELTIAHLKDKHGIDLMLIEESYISKYLSIHDDLENRGYLVKRASGETVFLDSNPWWGKGGMLDWTNPEGGDYFHDLKRQPLIDMGITYHWTDLGEPEMYDPSAVYYGVKELGLHNHGQIHNLYNFKWLESIKRGYERNNIKQRPFMMSRSGAPGIQRFGAAMWSGDIGANFNALRSSFNVQMHLSLSGIDYFGSDIGGFHRRPDTLDGDQNKLFTQWFANASVLDFPVRSHTWNLANSLETSPNLIGDKYSNLANIKQRYELSPYYYSVARQAFETGDPIIRPMVYEFEKDLNVREMANQKMVGSWLMNAVVASYNEVDRNVYLPEGKWLNYHTGHVYQSKGEYVFQVPTQQNGVFRTPLFVREGAIIPMMKVDESVLNILGKRKNNQTPFNELLLKVFPRTAPSSFDLYEDDGQTTGYLKNEYAKTKISQVRDQSRVKVQIAATRGTFSGQQERRALFVRIYTPGEQADKVFLSGASLKKCSSGDQDCYELQDQSVVVKLGERSIRKAKNIEVLLVPRAQNSTSVFFVCYNGHTVNGQSVYVETNISGQKRSFKLDPSDYPIWTSLQKDFPRLTQGKFNCVKKWDSDQNSVINAGVEREFKTNGSTYSGKAVSNF